jgi:hypothetical protein
MLLARELLDRGRTDAVIEYLRRCLSFWAANENQLRQWIQDIQGGERPILSNPLNPLEGYGASR